MSIRIDQAGRAVADAQPPQPQPQPQAQQQPGQSQPQQQKPSTPAAPPAAAPSTPPAADTNSGTDAAKPARPGNGVDFEQFKPTYDSKYDEQLADLYNQITNRKPFQYNSNDDALYQQYMDRYIQGGNKAMEDTMGKTAALTGGYSSSYAQQVGQQTYDEYLQGLNDKALELEERAYRRWQDEGDALKDQYGMLGDLDNRDYDRWSDEYSRAQAEAALRAQFGDFEAFKQMWGDEAGGKMQAAWVAQTLMPLYKDGLIDEETFKDIAGQYPAGYVPPGEGGGGGSGGSSWYVDAFNAANALGLNAEKAQDFFKDNAATMWGR